MASASASTVIDLGNLTSSWAPLTYKMGNCTIRFQRPQLLFLLIASAISLVLYLSFSDHGLRAAPFPSLSPRQSASVASIIEAEPGRPAYNYTYPLTAAIHTSNGVVYRIAVIADPDTESKVPDKADLWHTYLKYGQLTWNEQSKSVTIDWKPDMVELTGSLSHGGRALELSELVVFDGQLLTVDDRTGVVYQLVDSNKLVPWVILSDGNGRDPKGFKSEWATVKDRHLFVGGLGKEWTTRDGNVLNFNPMFVKKISTSGQVQHLDWHDHYVRLRSAAGIEFPGYMIHEAVAWSEVHQRWFFLPRKASKSKYNDVDDERHGTNYLLTVNDNFDPTSIQVSRIGDLKQEQSSHGFSSFKFIPGTKDTVVVALKSEELEGSIATYVTVFHIDGTIYLPETKMGDLKFEGIEFV